MLRKALSALAITCLLALPARAAEIFVGGFSFSDELGGFRLLSVSGSGSRNDPFVIVEELTDFLPATLVIRRKFDAPDPMASPGDRLFHVVKVVHNLTNRTWTGFDLELREIINIPSKFHDGLSFDQVEKKDSDVVSDRFAHQYRRFEPSDSIRFEQGRVDPGTQLRLNFPIADITPVAEFYLVQEPVILSVASLREPGVLNFAYAVSPACCSSLANPMLVRSP